MLILVLQTSLLGQARAGQVQAWTYPEFAHDDPVSGTDGWRSGYDLDDWLGYDTNDGSFVFPETDDNGGGFGDGGPMDNWLVNDAADVGDGLLEAWFHSPDDDPIGLVISFDDGSYYLFLLCGAPEGRDPDCPLAQDPFSAIVRVEGGEWEILAEADETFQQGDLGFLTFSINDGVVEATYEDIGLALSVQDSSSARVNGVGFWAYDAGGADSSWVGFGEPVLSAYDDDDDGVIDDLDNCEFDANTDQADGDGDTIGDVCDEAPDDSGVTDTGLIFDTDTDTDRPGNGGKYNNGGLGTPGYCGCDGAAGLGTGALGLAPLLFAAFGARRRRA